MGRFRLTTIYEEKSITRTVRMRLSTLEKIEKIAKDNDVTVNKVITRFIEYALDKFEEEMNEEDINESDEKEQD